MEAPGIDRAHELLQRSAAALWANRQDVTYVSRYGYRGGELAPTTRVGWCYGDLAVSAVLRLAGSALGNEEYLVAARMLALHAARRSPLECGATDPGLCHGAASVLHLARLAQDAYPDEALRAMVGAWAALTCRYARSSDLRGPWDRVGPPQVGLLAGGSGVALALLGVCDPGSASWDRVLLLSRATAPSRGLHSSISSIDAS